MHGLLLIPIKSLAVFICSRCSARPLSTGNLQAVTCLCSDLLNLPALPGLLSSPRTLRQSRGTTPLGSSGCTRRSYIVLLADHPRTRTLGALRESLCFISGAWLGCRSAHRPLDRDHLLGSIRFANRMRRKVLGALALVVPLRIYLNDLLHWPYTRSTLALVANMSNEYSRAVTPHAPENPIDLCSLSESNIPEVDFNHPPNCRRRTGAGLLLDVNNVFVRQKSR